MNIFVTGIVCRKLVMWPFECFVMIRGKGVNFLAFSLEWRDVTV